MINPRLTQAGRGHPRIQPGGWVLECVVFFAALLGISYPAIGQTIYEAENTTLAGPLIANANGGYSGSGYADYNNVNGEYVEFTLNANSSGSYPIAFRYANGSGTDRPLSLKVNGATVLGSLSFPATAGWATWGFTATNNVVLNAGVNTVRISDIGSNGPNVDYMLVMTAGTGPLAANAINAPLRRPISPIQPLLMVHVDSWNAADPQKIIDLIPADIRPYAVMNLSLSIYHDTNGWLQVEYGYETAKSWLRTCAENGMWAMIQPSSGGYSHLSDYDMSAYEEFFREYPNFLGISYAEQFWGFDDIYAGSVPWTTRVAHWTELMKLNQKYGGYLMVSWCGNQWDANINPLAAMKRNPAFAAICKQSPQYFILCEKYTQGSYLSDMESVCLGDFLAGYAGHYGIRYDSTGWSDVTGVNQNFTLVTGGAPIIEHAMLTGQTVIDGPELIWQQDIRNLGTGTTPDGFTTRRWEFFQQYQKFVLDVFRKILDGTIRIPSRAEVISRTKVVILNDVTSGSNDNQYSSPDTLFEGLYRMDVDGNYANNKYFFKKTGRYPSIPTAYQLVDSTASNLFTVKVNKSGYSTRWPSITSKTNEFNALFPQEYTGDLYAGRHENGWVIYNPYKTNITASSSIPFKYNTCDHVDITLSRYTTGVMKEYSNDVTFYLCNYDNSLDTSLKTSTISIYGSTVEPTYSWIDRGGYAAASVTKTWAGGVWSLTVQHNGSVDISVNCAGTGVGRLTGFTVAPVVPPVAPPVAYTGPRQNEAEHFDYKSIQQNLNYGINSGVTNYTGLGYIKFGTGSAASVRDSVSVLNGGPSKLQTKYSLTGANVSTIDLYVNGVKVATPTFTQTGSYSSWAIDQRNITLNAGANTIEYRANGTAAASVYFDNFVVVPTVINGGIVIQENQAGFVGVDGVIETANAGYTGDGYANASNSIGAGINWNLSFDASVIKSFTFRYAGTADSTADLVVGGVNVASGIRFPATGSLATWENATVYVSVPAGAANARLQSTSAAGLPNIDYLQVAGGWIGTPPPTGLNGVAVSRNQINLSWTASSTATGYNVKRSLTNGGPYSVVASGITTTNYSDMGLAGGTLYYYVVSAVSGLGEGSDSTQASAATQTGSIGSLVHRYSFSETGGATVADSVGGPVWKGTLPSGGTLSAGQLTLVGASANYASLPAGLVSTLNDFTIEAWVRLNSTTNWSRTFDFGNNTTTYMFLTPQNSANSRLRFAITTGGNGAEQQIDGPAALAAGIWYHVALTLNGNTGTLYVNGVAVGTNGAMTLRPSTLGATLNNYIGKSQWPDPYFNGLIDEFRIYNTALSASEIAATYALGSGQVLNPYSPALNVSAAPGSLTLTWPLASAGFTVQSRTNLSEGSWVNVPSPVPQIVGGQWQIALPVSSETNAVYYRLFK